MYKYTDCGFYRNKWKLRSVSIFRDRALDAPIHPRLPYIALTRSPASTEELELKAQLRIGSASPAPRDHNANKDNWSVRGVTAI
jgi:hypothetical protein